MKFQERVKRIKEKGRQEGEWGKKRLLESGKSGEEESRVDNR